jgi:replicative DNA helicase
MNAAQRVEELPGASPTEQNEHPWTLSEVMADIEERVINGDVERFRPLPTGFHPLDDVLAGGLRPGELMIVGGAFGVGKTILALQTARNVVMSHPSYRVMYVCYEHDTIHLLMRLLALESAEHSRPQDALTLRKLVELAFGSTSGAGLISRLRSMPRYALMMQHVDAYANRLSLIRASGVHGTLERIHCWAEALLNQQAGGMLLVVDYLQKVPLETVLAEDEATTRLAQGLKELAMTLGIPVLAIAASDRAGLKARRMRLSDLRGGSALQYEADIGIVLHNKHEIVSREHLVFNAIEAEEMRKWVVMSVEKNRAGVNAIDMEYALDAAHFRLLSDGDMVRERLVDEKVVLQ